MAKLTKRTVDAAKPFERDYIIWDDAIPSFGLRIFASGRRSYLVQYRKAGRTKRFTLGAHGHLTAEEARTKARKLLSAITDGADPSGDRKRARNLPIIGALCDRYIEEHLPTNKASTAKEHKRLVERRIRPTFGTTRVDGITRQNVRDWHQGMKAIPYEANRSLAVLSKILSLAVNDWGSMSENPCLGMKRHPEKARNRYFTDDEFKRIGEALATAENTLALPTSALIAIRLLALTGLRASEVLGLRWADIDLQRGAIYLRDAKAGERAVSIGAITVAFLADLDRKSEFVAPGTSADTPLSLSTLEKSWATIRDAAKLTNARLHDLRHSVGTLAAQTGANAFMVRDKLGHRTLAMTGRYVERNTDSLRHLSDQVENRIASAMAGKAADIEKMPANQRS